MEVFANGGVLARLKILHFQGFTQGVFKYRRADETTKKFGYDWL